MAHWEIAKEFHFEYGHRVWSQELDSELSLGAACACRHLHGHSGVVKVFLKGDKLIRDMVFDFKNLEFMKKFVDGVLDHKMILDIKDPYTADQLDILALKLDDFVKHQNGYLTVSPERLQIYTNSLWSHRAEIAEGLVLVDFVPTSENLCKWFHKVAQDKLTPHGITVSRVQFFETKKSESNYYKEGE